MLSWTFMDCFFQYYHKAHKNIAYSIENSLRQPAAKFFPQKGANLKSKKAHCGLFFRQSVPSYDSWYSQILKKLSKSQYLGVRRCIW